METKFKEVAHLYIGCKIKENVEVSRSYDLFIYKVILNNPSDIVSVGNNRISKNMYFREFKPILYPLCTMQEPLLSDVEGRLMYHAYCNEIDSEIKNAANLTAILLSHHFDLFGLIESGQAIDGSTI